MITASEHTAVYPCNAVVAQRIGEDTHSVLREVQYFTFERTSSTCVTVSIIGSGLFSREKTVKLAAIETDFADDMDFNDESLQLILLTQALEYWKERRATRNFCLFKLALCLLSLTSFILDVVFWKPSDSKVATLIRFVYMGCFMYNGAECFKAQLNYRCFRVPLVLKDTMKFERQSIL